MRIPASQKAGIFFYETTTTFLDYYSFYPSSVFYTLNVFGIDFELS